MIARRPSRCRSHTVCMTRPLARSFCRPTALRPSSLMSRLSPTSACLPPVILHTPFSHTGTTCIRYSVALGSSPRRRAQHRTGSSISSGEISTSQGSALPTSSYVCMRGRVASTWSTDRWTTATAAPQRECRRTVVRLTSTSATAQVARLLARKATSWYPAAHRQRLLRPQRRQQRQLLQPLLLVQPPLLLHLRQRPLRRQQYQSRRGSHRRQGRVQHRRLARNRD